MNGRAKRLALTSFAALALLLQLYDKSHGPSPAKRDAVAFLHRTPGKALVKVAGIPEFSGIYQVSVPATIGSVIKLSVPADSLILLDDSVGLQRVCEGDVIIFDVQHTGYTHVSCERMSAHERVTLGIPLDLSSMSRADWEALPGIGPATAQSILEYRQQIGDFTSFRQLGLVPGIGPATMSRLKPYFFGYITPCNY